MGYQPTNSRYYEMYKQAQERARVLQIENNQLVGEIAKMKERERLGIEEAEKADPRKELEELEDKLWNAQDNLRLEKTYTYGFATATVVLGPAGGATLWMATLVDNGLLEAACFIIGFAVSFLAVLCLIITFTKIFGAIPEAKKDIAGYQRRVDRITLKELGL